MDFSGPEYAEIRQIWDQVQARVVQLAGGRTSDVKKGLSIDDVLRTLDDAHAREAKVAEKYGQVKSVFNGVLKCIETVGGIVSSAASEVSLIPTPATAWSTSR